MQYRGIISEQFVAEREIAQQWLLTRFGITVNSYAESTDPDYPNFYSVDFSVVTGPTNYVSGDFTLYYQPFTWVQNMCVTNSCSNIYNGTRVVLLEHRYMIVSETDVQYISYGYMQFYEAKCGDLPSQVYTYRSLYPLHMSLVTNNLPLTGPITVTDSAAATFYGGTVAEIAIDGQNFNGNFSYVIDNTFYIKSNTIEDIVTGEEIVENTDFLRRRLTGTVFFPGTNPCVQAKLDELEIEEYPEVVIQNIDVPLP